MIDKAAGEEKKKKRNPHCPCIRTAVQQKLTWALQGRIALHRMSRKTHPGKGSLQHAATKCPHPWVQGPPLRKAGEAVRKGQQSPSGPSTGCYKPCELGFSLLSLQPAAPVYSGSSAKQRGSALLHSSFE